MAYDPKGNIFKQLYDAIVALDSVGGGGGGGGNVTVVNPDPIPVSTESLPLPTGAALEDGNLDAIVTLVDGLEGQVGAVTEAAPGTDTASSGLNGRLQRIAQRLGEALGRLPASLGQKASAASMAVVVASDQTTLPVSATYAAPVTSTQTLTGIGLSASVAAAGKASFGVQLLWTGASTPQVVRLSGSFDGGSTWHLLGNTIGGETFSVQDVSDFAAAGLQPGLRWRTTTPELTQVRLRWVSGTATNLTIKWGVA